MGRCALFVVGLLLGVALLAPTPAFAIIPIQLDQDWNLRADGGSNSENLGVSLANTGDVNGDGVDDMAVGAVNASEVFVVYGQPDASRAVISAGTLTGVQGYRIKGVAQKEAGLSVANAGDVNGDGVPDQVIGAAGVAYVVFGQRTANPTTIDLANLGTPGNHQGYRILDGPDDGLIGTSSAGVGDVNGDGIPDQLVGGSANHNGRTQSGSVYVLFGQRGSVADIELGTLTPAQGYRIDGADAGDVLGTSVAAAGDVNGDGLPDFLMGAGNRSFMGRFASGSAYLIYGRRSSATPIDLALLTPPQGYEMGGQQLADAGNSVADAGDVDGDGVPDALVGAPAAGQSYIVFGQRSSPSTVDLADVGTTGNHQGTLLDTPFDGSSFGFSVAAGDVNGDGIPDAIVGDSGATAPPGEGFIVFGRRPSPERISTAGIGVGTGDTAGIVLLNQGGGPTPANGAAVLNTGDLDHDGADDVAMGAPFNTPGNFTTEGSVFTMLSRLALPETQTGPATDVTATSARLTGTVGTDPVTCVSASTPVTAHFELGTTTAYGTTTAPTTAGLGAGDVDVSGDASGLSAGTYHYRLVAECADGAQRFGADRTFDVPQAAPSGGGGGGGSSGSGGSGSSSSSSSSTTTTTPPTVVAPSTTTPATVTAQVVVASLARRLVVVRNGRALVTLRCNAPRGQKCRGRLTLSASGTLGRRSYAVPGGARRTIAVRLRASARGRIARSARGLRARATTVTRELGASATTKRSTTVVLRRLST